MLVRIIARFQLAMAKPLMFLIVKNGEDERSRNETSVLVTVAAFDHWKRCQFVPWKALLLFLPSLLSSATSVSSPASETPYWRHHPSMQGNQQSLRKEPANYEKIGAREFFGFGKIGISLTLTILPLDSPGFEASSNSIRRAS